MVTWSVKSLFSELKDAIIKIFNSEKKLKAMKKASFSKIQNWNFEMMVKGFDDAIAYALKREI